MKCEIREENCQMNSDILKVLFVVIISNKMKCIGCDCHKFQGKRIRIKLNFIIQKKRSFVL